MWRIDCRYLIWGPIFYAACSAISLLCYLKGEGSEAI